MINCNKFKGTFQSGSLKEGTDSHYTVFFEVTDLQTFQFSNLTSQTVYGLKPAVYRKKLSLFCMFLYFACLDYSHRLLVKIDY